MNISRLLRVLLTIILVISLVLIVVSEYRHDRKVEMMVKLSDASSSILVRLTNDELAYRTPEGRRLEHLVDPFLLENMDPAWTLAGENYESRVSLSFGENLENTIGPFGPDRPEGEMANALACSVVAVINDRRLPAKLKVMVWEA